MGKRIVRARVPFSYFCAERGASAHAALRACLVVCAVYETVKKKEAERRRDAAAAAPSDEPRFADVLKEQWEARKREMAAAEKKAG